jgi:hypothetical protein
MCNLGKLFYVKDHHSRIGNGFSEHQFGIRAESLVYLFFAGILVNERAFDAHLLHRNSQQIVCPAINTGRTYNMISCLANIEESEKTGCLPGRCQDGTDTSFQCGNLRSDGIIGRVLQTSIKIAVLLQIEKASHLLTRIIFKCSTLVNRQNTRLAIFGIPSCLNAQCFPFKVIIHIVSTYFSPSKIFFNTV